MLPVAKTEATILDLVQPFDAVIDSEILPLSQTSDRILARDIMSQLDFPHWHNSAMDGYALRYSDLDNLDNSGNLQLAIAAAEIPAGKTEVAPLQQGQCMRIFTGGMLPEGADTVIMQEDTERLGDILQLKVKPKQGEYVRRQGEFLKAGTKILDAGIKLTATEIGAIASMQISQVQVFRKPRVAIFSTGDELVSLDELSPAISSLRSGQIIDSNLYALTALVNQAGAIAVPLGNVNDAPIALEQMIQKALSAADLVISTGGVSVGDYDYVDRLLEKLGAKIHIREVAIKPGKPLTVASFEQDRQNRQILYFGVPGNPVSAMVSFWRFIQGAIAKLSGANAAYWHPQFIQATTTADLHAQGRRETYIWGRLTYQQGRPIFEPVPDAKSGYSSGNLISAIATNALAVMRVHQTYVPAGDSVNVMLI